MELRTLDLNLLKAFDALMDERSVTRAASRLALTQPAVSGILNRLRDSFGDPLFVRSSHGITPTPRALALTAPIKRVLADIEGLLKPDAFDPARADFTISVAATDYSLGAVVVPFIAALRAPAPGIRVAVRQFDAARVLERMERGELDMALLTPQAVPPELHSRRLFEEQYVCVLREGHPLARVGPLSLDQFCDLDHGLVTVKDGEFRSATDEALARLGRSRRVTLSMPSFATLLDVVRTSDLAALVPRRLLTGASGLVLAESPVDTGGFTKVLAWHARTHEDQGHRWARTLMFQACGGLA